MPDLESIAYKQFPTRRGDYAIKKMERQVLELHSGVEITIVNVDVDAGNHRVILYQNGSTPNLCPVQMKKNNIGIVFPNNADAYKAPERDFTSFPEQ